MIKGIIHKEDRHCKPLGHLTTKKQRYLKQKSEEIYGKIKKHIIIMRHINISLRILYQVQKNKNRRILNHVTNTLKIIDFYLTNLY